MPQLDITAFFAQIMAFAAGFGALHLSIRYHILPKIARMTKFRHTKETNEKRFNTEYFKRMDVREYDAETSELVFRIAQFRVKLIKNLQDQYAFVFQTNPLLSKTIEQSLADSELKKNPEMLVFLQDLQKRINKRNEKKS